MRSFLQERYLSSISENDHHVVTFGRMNPPTSGHEKLVGAVHAVAKQHNASHEVILSHSQDAKNNPLSPAQKLKHARRAFPGTHVTVADKAHPTLLHHLARLHKQGVKHLHVVVGSDRVKEFHDIAHKYNGVAGRHGHYNFKSITVHSAGERDPDAKGVSGMSGSKLRAHANAGNYSEYRKGVSSQMSDKHAKDMYHDIRRGSGLKD
jgi:hypothetical protein